MTFPKLLIAALPVAVAMGQAPTTAKPAQAKPAAAPAKPAAAKPATAKPATAAKPAASTAKPAEAKPAGDAAAPKAVAPDAVVLKVGDVALTAAEYEMFISGLNENLQQQAKGPQKRKVAEQLAEIKALAVEARKRKLDQKPENKLQLAFQAENFLAGSLVRDAVNSNTPDEAMLKDYYEKHKGEYEQAKGRHILIRMQGSRVPVREGQKDLTDQEAANKAKEILAKLNAGGDFAAIAKAESDDTGSGSQGGDLGSFSRGQMVQQFEEAAFSQPIGVIGGPVKTMFGYHIIQIQERSAKSFDEVKSDIEGKIKPDVAKKFVDQIKTQVPITLNDDYFGKP